jgi:hypothetical protein
MKRTQGALLNHLLPVNCFPPPFSPMVPPSLSS